MIMGGAMVHGLSAGGAVGLAGGVLVGSLLLAAAGGGRSSEGWVALSGFVLLLVIFGHLYDLLGRRRLINTAYSFVTIFYWALAFPLCRFLYDLFWALSSSEISASAPSYVTRGDFFSFLAFQAVVGSVYGLGFRILHSNFLAMARAIASWRR
jgi:hypothetical protein